MLTPKNSPPSSTLLWPLTAGAFAMIAAVGVGLLYPWDTSKPSTEIAPPPPGGPMSVSISIPAMLDDAEPLVKFHSYDTAEENGTKVVKIRFHESGDELVLDAATGRLLETRPSQPLTVPPPNGKFAAPFAPMM